MPVSTDKKRIFVLGSDRKRLYHLMSIIQSEDGSFYCNLGDRINKKDTHFSYHASGKINLYMGKQKTYEATIEPPSKIRRIINLPAAIAHLNLLQPERTLDIDHKIQEFNPTNLIFVDLHLYKDKSVNIHAFLFPPDLIDYIKTPFIFDEEILQIQLDTFGFPWIGFIVLSTNRTLSGPPIAQLTSKQDRDRINKYYEEKFAASS